MSGYCNTKLPFPSDKFRECCDIIFSSCIAYNGPEECLDFGMFPSLNEVIGKLLEKICDVEQIDAACLREKGYTITNRQQWTAAVSDVICQILGCQTPVINGTGTITSLCALNNRLNEQTVSGCFHELTDIGSTVRIEVLLTALQNSVCQLYQQSKDEKVKVSATDTTSGYLMQKVAASDSLTWTTQNNGGNEQYRGELRKQNSPSIDLTVNAQGLRADLKVVDSFTVDATIDPLGLKSDVRFQDTNSVNMGADSFGLKADLRIDPVSTAPVSITTDGLRVDCCVQELPDPAIDCEHIVKNGSVVASAPISGVNISVPYTCTVSGPYSSQIIPSNETVGGAPVAYAATPAGNYSTPGGTILFNVSGTTVGYGGSTITFNINVNGATCPVVFSFNNQTQYTVNCDDWGLVCNPLKIGQPVSAASGTPYLWFRVNVTQIGASSTIVLNSATAGGLTFTGGSITLSPGQNTVIMNMSGSPTLQNFMVPVSIVGYSPTPACSFPLEAKEDVGSYTLDCKNCAPSLADATEQTAYNATINFCYVGGTNGPVPGVSVIGFWQGQAGVAAGLYLTIPPVVVTGPTGTFVGTISGTPNGSGTVVFSIPNMRV